MRTERNCPMLDKHPVIKQLFVRYNNCLPSSASDDSSIVSFFGTQKRLNRLDDKLFETLAMLKVNQHYCM